MSKRIVWIDIAKGICMLSVIAGHLGIADVNSVVFSFHLTLFFILSGYTLKPEISSRSVAKRFTRLMLPYFVTCCAILIVDIFNLIVTQKITDTAAITYKLYADITRSFFGSGAHTYLGTVQLPGRIGAIWFLPAMFFATVLTQFIITRVSDVRKRYIIAIAAAIMSFISGRFVWFPFSVQSAIFSVPFIMLGYDAKNNGIFEKIKLPHFLLSLGIFLVGLYVKLTSASFVTASMDDILLMPVFALASCACIVHISQKLEFMMPLAFVGRYSMYYLCIHLFELETMGIYFKQLIEAVGLPYTNTVRFLVRVIFGTVVTLLILLVKKLYANIKRPNTPETKRDVALDISKAILIILMVVGHFQINSGLRSIIYSFHMPAFIIFSGYMFKPNACDNLGRSVLRLIKSFLVPYAVFAAGYLLIRPGDIPTKVKSLVFGISCTKELFTDVIGIGVFYFVLLLFAIRLTYLLLYKFIKSEVMLTGSVLFLTLVGYLLGKDGYWLPWSFDVAIYSLIFYHIGYYLKKYNILEFLASRPYYYFILASIWAYTVFSGSLELAVRVYGEFGIAIIGAICATAVIYMLSRFIHASCGKIINVILSVIGRNTMYILLVHSLFGSTITSDIVPLLGFTNGYIYSMVVAIAVNIIAGTLLGLIIEGITAIFKLISNKRKTI